MSDLLLYHGLLDVVTAEQITSENAEYDRRAKTLIRLHLASSITIWVHNKATAKEVWDTLTDLFAASVQARREQLRKEIRNFVMSKDEDMPDYLRRAKQLQEDMAAIKEEVDETELWEAVLWGLPEKYEVDRKSY